MKYGLSRPFTTAAIFTSLSAFGAACAEDETTTAVAVTPTSAKDRRRLIFANYSLFELFE